MATTHLPEFVMSTGRLLDAIQALRKSSSAEGVSKFWSRILEIFFPSTKGFECTLVYQTPDHVILVLRRTKDADGDVIVDDSAINIVLVVDCRPSTTSSEPQTILPEKNTVDGQIAKAEVYEEKLPSEFGIIATGTQAVFVKDAELSATSTVVCSGATQDYIQLHGSNMGSANLAKASGRDQAEEWLRTMLDGSTK